MDWFKELWNGVWHAEAPTNETIRWMVECGLGEVICFAIIIIPFLVGFLLYCRILNWRYWEKPRRDFQRRHMIVEQTRDFTVYDMTDAELDEYESGIDF